MQQQQQEEEKEEAFFFADACHVPPSAATTTTAPLQIMKHHQHGHFPAAADPSRRHSHSLSEIGGTGAGPGSYQG
ncbi:hypothetical protein A2U01_0083803, partial [Trifolium medium]|nr:hypothetical protein [Trifolium medium]